MEQLTIDEWKIMLDTAGSSSTDNTVNIPFSKLLNGNISTSTQDVTSLKESKIEKLNTLVRILKNTADIDMYYPKKKMIAQ